MTIIDDDVLFAAVDGVHTFSVCTPLFFAAVLWCDFGHALVVLLSAHFAGGCSNTIYVLMVQQLENHDKCQSHAKPPRKPPPQRKKCVKTHIRLYHEPCKSTTLFAAAAATVTALLAMHYFHYLLPAPSPMPHAVDAVVADVAVPAVAAVTRQQQQVLVVLLQQSRLCVCWGEGGMVCMGVGWCAWGDVLVVMA